MAEKKVAANSQKSVDKKVKKPFVEGEKCVLYDRDCIGCGECQFCDLDPLKICDNCGKCIEMDDVASIKIDAVYDDREKI